VIDDKYRIEGKLGEGAMGIVYRGVQINLGRRVAIKVMRGDFTAEPRRAERFKREALAVARVKHPNAVTVYDFGVAPEVGAYCVMEYLEGVSLREELTVSHTLPVESVVELMDQICAAVDAAHSAGVIHRDLKPSNIMLERLGDGAVAAKVLDFGIAKLVAPGDLANHQLTVDGAAVGTPLYMSPEQCDGLLVDARSDVYALGCVCYEMLVGRPPFRASSEAAIFIKHMTRFPRSPSDLNPDVPTSFDGVVLRALAKLPGQRFQSAREFSEALSDAYSRRAMASTARTAAPRVLERTIAEPLLHDVPRAPSHNLPPTPTSFVGRQSEILQIDKLARLSRLVTLTGVGGCGKTRLALAYAEQRRAAFPGGTWFVELAGVTDGRLVAHVMAASVGRANERGVDSRDAIARIIGNSVTLVVLDNCEHLLGAVAEAAEWLLRTCPSAAIVATSRESLGIRGEAVLSVPLLALPDEATERDLDSLAAVDSVRLFVDRASVRRAGFELTEANSATIARICRRLEGLPLAIELAAARAHVLSVDQIEERLGDRFRLLKACGSTTLFRQQTLLATIDWSHELLDERERMVFRRIAVFAGNWTLDDAESVVAFADLEAFEVLDLTEALVGKSLVVVVDGGAELHYRMLEMVREYGLARLAESGEEFELRDRHLGYFAELSQHIGNGLAGPEQTALLRRYDSEAENIRSALSWSLDGGGSLETGLAIGGAIWLAWVMRGPIAESLRWLEAAIEKADASGEEVSPLVLARARTSAANLATIVNRIDDANTLVDRAFEDFQREGDAKGMAAALTCRGVVAFKTGDAVRAAEIDQRGLVLAKACGDDLLTANLLNNLAGAFYCQDEFGRAVEALEECQSLRRRMGDRWGLARALSNLGELRIETREPSAARPLLVEALAIQAVAGDQLSVVYALEALLRCAALDRRASSVARCYGGARAVREKIGVLRSPEETEAIEEALAWARAELGESEFERLAVEAGHAGLDGAASFVSGEG